MGRCGIHSHFALSPPFLMDFYPLALRIQLDVQLGLIMVIVRQRDEDSLSLFLNRDINAVLSIAISLASDRKSLCPTGMQLC